MAAGWQVESIDLGDLPFGIAAVAASGQRLVAVGWRTCVPEDEPTDCWANAYTSDDGGRSWVTAPRSEALVVSFGGIGSGPESGMLDVAAGHGAFVAIGYDEQFRTAIWKSVDGSEWTKSPADATYQARVRSVAATATGWVIGGEVFLDSGPRAAIWTSPDGVTWTRVPDGPAFDIGGYLDTGEEPGAGGIADVIAQGSMTIAVGSACDGNGPGVCAGDLDLDRGSVDSLIPWRRCVQREASGRGALRAGRDRCRAGVRSPDVRPGRPAGSRPAALQMARAGLESGIPGTSGIDRDPGTGGDGRLPGRRRRGGRTASMVSTPVQASQLILVGSIDGADVGARGRRSGPRPDGHARGRHHRDGGWLDRHRRIGPGPTSIRASSHSWSS